MLFETQRKKSVETFDNFFFRYIRFIIFQKQKDERRKDTLQIFLRIVLNAHRQQTSNKIQNCSFHAL